MIAENWKKVSGRSSWAVVGIVAEGIDSELVEGFVFLEGFVEKTKSIVVGIEDLVLVVFGCCIDYNPDRLSLLSEDNSLGDSSEFLVSSFIQNRN